MNPTGVETVTVPRIKKELLRIYFVLLPQSDKMELHSHFKLYVLVRYITNKFGLKSQSKLQGMCFTRFTSLGSKPRAPRFRTRNTGIVQSRVQTRVLNLTNLNFIENQGISDLFSPLSPRLFFFEFIDSTYLLEPFRVFDLPNVAWVCFCTWTSRTLKLLETCSNRSDVWELTIEIQIWMTLMRGKFVIWTTEHRIHKPQII